MTKKKGVTAAELMAQLNADPNWVVARANEETERQRRVDELRQAERPLVQELREAGFDVQSVWDFVNAPIAGCRALPILLDHLQRPYPARVREGIARALATPQAKIGWGTLTELFRKEMRGPAKDGLAVAIGVIADDSVINEVISLVGEKQHGASRIFLLSALAKSRDPLAHKTLLELESDPDMHLEVRNILHRSSRRKTMGAGWH